MIRLYYQAKGEVSKTLELFMHLEITMVLFASNIQYHTL